MMIGDIPVAKGTGLNYAVMVNMYKKDYFDDPLEFRPERWEE